MVKAINLDTEETTHDEEKAALDRFAAEHTAVVRLIGAGTVTAADLKPFRQASAALEACENEVLVNFAKAGRQHIESAFAAMQASPGRRKRRLMDKMRRKGDKLQKIIEETSEGVD